MAYRYKSRAVASQRSYLRSRDLKQGIEFRILLARHQYTAARNALSSLCGPGEWEKVWRELRPEDIRGLNEQVLTAEENQIYQHTREMAGLSAGDSVEELLNNILTMSFSQNQVGDGTRTLSWIWYSVSDGELDGSIIHDSELPQPCRQ